MAGRSNSRNKIQTVDTCKDATSLILEFLSGELSPETGSEFEKHLQICPDCVAFLNTYKKTIELTKRFLLKK
ncbi:MAG: zf-HC2 domain-containing protein [Thermodesulfobacteriota bacterium]